MSVSYYRIGRNIAAERNRAGLTQEEMAERMGISVSHYSNIERANRHATIDFLVCMCETLGIPLARLVHGAIGGIALEGDESLQDKKEDIVQRISRIIDGCSEKAKENLLQICILAADIDNSN